MKKLILFLFLTVTLCGLPGCKTSRATVKTDTDRNTRKTEFADSSRNQQTTSSDQKTAALSSNEQKMVVIEFDEWEYCQPGDTNTAGNYAHNSPDSIRTGRSEADKPPNAGTVTRHIKGTITINGNKQTEQTATESSTSETSIKETGSRKATLDEAVNEKTSQKTETRNGSKLNAFAFGIVFALLAVAVIVIGIYLARRK